MTSSEADEKAATMISIKAHGGWFVV